jgi:hypothetical protein
MTFRFKEGDAVQLKVDRPALGLRAGDAGTVWALYALEPPAYEVTFPTENGDAFDVTLTEDELLAVVPSPSFGVSDRQPKSEAA